MHHPTSTHTRMKRARKRAKNAKRGCLNKSAMLLLALVGMIAVTAIVAG